MPYKQNYIESLPGSEILRFLRRLQFFINFFLADKVANNVLAKLY